jgi:peptidoglycan/xylan/chitin deacetylase (PgdA/CDA1 family)
VKPGIDLATPAPKLRRYAWISVISKIPLAWCWHSVPNLSLAVFVAPELWLAYQTLAPNATGLGPVTTAFPVRRREIWLTIDDGPDPDTTPPLLDLLDAHHAKAIFFVIGRKARRHPDLVRMIAERGHELGNHTENHPLGFFWCAGPRRTAAEVDGGSQAIADATGMLPRYFRPPAGIKNLALFGTLRARGLTCLGWSGRGREFGCSEPSRPLRRLIRNVKPGAILLVHESRPNAKVRMAVIAGLLKFLTERDYACVLPPARHPVPPGAAFPG